MRFVRNKLVVFTLILLLFCGGLFVYSQASGSPSFLTDLVGTVSAPVQRLLSAGLDKLNDFFGYFHRYDDLEAENAALRDQVAQLQQLEARYHAALDENEHLRDLSGLAERHADFEWALAYITSVQTGGFQKGFSIDRGEKHGVSVGDPVMSHQGLVGYVSSVGSGYSEVTTLVSMEFKAGARVSRTRETVVAEGSFELSAKNRFRLSFLDNNMDLKEGDLIETAGSGGLFPKGLILGTVESIALEPSGISSTAVVRPAVDFSDLTAVFVVTDFSLVD